jgi:hypothetical protein
LQPLIIYRLPLIFAVTHSWLGDHRAYSAFQAWGTPMSDISLIGIVFCLFFSGASAHDMSFLHFHSISNITIIGLLKQLLLEQRKVSARPIFDLSLPPLVDVGMTAYKETRFCVI